MILIFLCDCLAAYNISPNVNAYYVLIDAYYFNIFLLFNYDNFSEGGLPSNTHIGLIPTYIHNNALYIIPIK